MATATDQLDRTFAALADSTRRSILARLAAGEASATELAKPFEMSMPGVPQPLKGLERPARIGRGRDRPAPAGPPRRRAHEGEADDEEFGFHGEYREIVRRERITWTFEFEPMPGHVSLQTVEFEERDGVTLLTGTARFDSVEDRDGMLQSGMEAGMTETLDR